MATSSDPTAKRRSHSPSLVSFDPRSLTASSRRPSRDQSEEGFPRGLVPGQSRRRSGGRVSAVGAPSIIDCLGVPYPPDWIVATISFLMLLIMYVLNILTLFTSSDKIPIRIKGIDIASGKDWSLGMFGYSLGTQYYSGHDSSQVPDQSATPSGPLKNLLRTLSLTATLERSTQLLIASFILDLLGWVLGSVVPRLLFYPRIRKWWRPRFHRNLRQDVLVWQAGGSLLLVAATSFAITAAVQMQSVHKIVQASGLESGERLFTLLSVVLPIMIVILLLSVAFGIHRVYPDDLRRSELRPAILFWGDIPFFCCLYFCGKGRHLPRMMKRVQPSSLGRVRGAVSTERLRSRTQPAASDKGKRPVDGANVRQKETGWKVTFTIPNIECGACTSTIERAIRRNEDPAGSRWITKIDLGVLDNFGVIEFRAKDGDAGVARLQTIIDGTGFEVEPDATQLVELEVDRNPEIRQVDIKFGTVRLAEHEQVFRSLVQHLGSDMPLQEEFRRIVSIGRTVGAIINPRRETIPLVRIKYRPKPPNFTIRKILAEIERIQRDHDLFPEHRPAIYQAPTIAERAEQIRRTRDHRLYIKIGLALASAIPTFAIGIVIMQLLPEEDATRMIFMDAPAAGVSLGQWIMFALSTPVFFYCAWDFHKLAWKNIWALWKPGKSFNKVSWIDRLFRFGSMDLLISAGSSIAFVSSVIELVVAGANNSNSVEDSLFYFDSVIFLIFFLLLGRMVEYRCQVSIGVDTRQLSALRAEEAELVTSEGAATFPRVVTSEGAATFPRDQFEFNDNIWVEGLRPPALDGVVTEGETMFNEAHLTGEDTNVLKNANSEIFCGTTNQRNTRVQIRVTAVAGETKLEDTLNELYTGMGTGSLKARTIKRLTSIFVPVIAYSALLTWLAWTYEGSAGVLPENYRTSDQSWPVWALEFAIATFIIACPCGLALAAPTAVSAGSSLAYKYGARATGGDSAFDIIDKVGRVVFDKTGTLTMDPDITQTWPERLSKATLQMVFALESMVNHPVSRAIRQHCSRALRHSDVDVFLEYCDGFNAIKYPGAVTCYIRVSETTRCQVVVGNEKGVSHATQLPREEFSLDIDQAIKEYQANDLSVVVIARQMETSGVKMSWKLEAVIGLLSVIRPEAKIVIEALRSRNIEVYMLTGDTRQPAELVATTLQIPSGHFEFGIKDSEKRTYIERLRNRPLTLDNSPGPCICMIGDGTNDAAAFQEADVGIAMSNSTVIARSTANFSLRRDDLTTFLTLRELGPRIQTRIKINTILAIVYNVSVIPIAAGAFYPVIRNKDGSHYRLSPTWSSLLMVLSSMSVVVSSALMNTRLPWLGFKPKHGLEAVENFRGRRSDNHTYLTDNETTKVIFRRPVSQARSRTPVGRSTS